MENAISFVPFEVQQIRDTRLLDENISFPATDVGSGIYVMRYEIVDLDYILLIGSGDMNTVMYACLQLPGVDLEEAIDIRYYEVDKLIANGTCGQLF